MAPKCPERMSELGMQNDEIEIRILPKAFFSQCLKKSCLTPFVISSETYVCTLYIFRMFPLFKALIVNSK